MLADLLGGFRTGIIAAFANEPGFITGTTTAIIFGQSRQRRVRRERLGAISSSER